MRLSSISGQHQELLLLGLDQPTQLAQQLGLSLETEANRNQLESLVQEIVAAYAPQVTGLVFTAELGYAAAALPVDQGILFCLERTLTDSDPLSIPVLQTNWSVEHVRNNAAVAKLCLFADPAEAELITKLELVNELYDSCRYEGIDFLLELHVIDGKRFSNEVFQERQMRLLRLFGSQCDILALEYPRTAVGCLSVSAELRLPWLLLDSATTTYPLAKEELRNALAGGATGLLCRRLLLPEFKKGEFSSEVFRTYLQKEGRDRALELARIITENVTLGPSN